MDLIFEVLMEIIMEPIIEVYTFAMMRFADKNKKINKDKIQVFVVFECIALIVVLFVGIVMLLETNGESLLGKILLFVTIGISAFQIICGCILKILDKKR